MKIPTFRCKKLMNTKQLPDLDVSRFPSYRGPYECRISHPKATINASGKHNWSFSKEKVHCTMVFLWRKQFNILSYFIATVEFPWSASHGIRPPPALCHGQGTSCLIILLLFILCIVFFNYKVQLFEISPWQRLWQLCFQMEALFRTCLNIKG